MAKVFDGGKFLKEHTCNITFSNGCAVSIEDLSDEGMAAIKAFSELADDFDVNAVRINLAAMLNLSAEQLAGVGIAEMKAVIDFLFESLFASK